MSLPLEARLRHQMSQYQDYLNSGMKFSTTASEVGVNRSPSVEEHPEPNELAMFIQDKINALLQLICKNC